MATTNGTQPVSLHHMAALHLYLNRDSLQGLPRMELDRLIDMQVKRTIQNANSGTILLRFSWSRWMRRVRAVRGVTVVTPGLKSESDGRENVRRHSTPARLRDNPKESRKMLLGEKRRRKDK